MRCRAGWVLTSFVLIALVSCADERGPVERAAAPTTTTTTTAPSTTTTARPTTTTEQPAPDGIAVPPRAAQDPVGLARQIRSAERDVRNVAVRGRQLAHAAVLQQVAYRQLAVHPEWDGAVLARLPTSLHRDVRRNVEARRQFRAMHSKLADTVPAWRIVSPPPSRDLLRYYREAEAEFDIPWQYLAAINLVETGMGRIRGTSIAGAQGPMQFMPATWEAFGNGGDVNDPHDAVLAAARYLAHNNGAHDIANALWNYNHSHRYVRGVMLYAAVLRDDPRAFRGFYNWGIFYLTTHGDIWLPLGYEESERVPVTQWLARRRG